MLYIHQTTIQSKYYISHTDWKFEYDKAMRSLVIHPVKPFPWLSHGFRNAQLSTRNTVMDLLKTFRMSVLGNHNQSRMISLLPSSRVHPPENAALRFARLDDLHSITWWLTWRLDLHFDFIATCRTGNYHWLPSRLLITGQPPRMAPDVLWPLLQWCRLCPSFFQLQYRGCFSCILTLR